MGQFAYIKSRILSLLKNVHFYHVSLVKLHENQFFVPPGKFSQIPKSFLSESPSNVVNFEAVFLRLLSNRLT